MKKGILLLVLLNWGLINAQINLQDSVYIYDYEGNKEWFNVQKDVFCFSLIDNSKYTGQLHSCVDTIIYYDNSYSQFNEIRFNPNSTPNSRLNFINYLSSLAEFDTYAKTLTKSNETYDKLNFFETDDVIMIRFNNPLITQDEINAFANNYLLELVYKPDSLLDKEISWSHSFIMRKNPKNPFQTSIELAMIINETENSIVKYADPNTYTVELQTCVEVDEMSNYYQNTKGSWFIKNDGGPIRNGVAGIAGADANICGCWGEGATGLGVKIGVIDFFGFQLSHPDFINSNIPHIVNLFDSPNPFDTVDVIFSNEISSHSMMVTGVIAAQPNNLLDDGYAVGAAYEATVIPYLCGIPTTAKGNREIIIKAVQRAKSDNCDVLNMSMTVAQPGILAGILGDAITTGRPDPVNPNIKRGMVVVAGTGNGNYHIGTPSASGATTPFPANQSKTIGVGWSNPDDYRASPYSPGPGGSWGITNIPPVSGSNYGNYTLHFDVVAPGIVIGTTDLINSSSNGYTIQRGGSLATPIVSSIAAMVLQKRPDLTYQQVAKIIRDGADKVHSTANGGIYNYINGYNLEMFAGRVNCLNSLMIAETLGLENTQNNINTVIKDMQDGTFYISSETNDELKSIKVFDLSGKLILEDNFNNSKAYKLDLTNFEKGIYLIHIFDIKENNFSTKLVR